MKTASVAPVLLLVAAAAAQDDTVVLTNGTVLDEVKVQSFEIRELKYTKGGKPDLVPSDRVLRVQLGKFKDVYRRGIAERDPDQMITVAREQLAAKNTLMAQLGYIEAARMFYADGKEANGAGALDELQKSIPDAGVLPEYYRLKFENYMGRGDAGGFQNASLIAKRFQADATTNAWPQGFAVESQFYIALAENAQGGDAKSLQSKLREVLTTSQGAYPQINNRANVQLAHSLREGGDKAGARKIYEDIAGKDVVDDNSRAGAYLGLGLLEMEAGDAANRDPFYKALIYFLRVRLETKDAWGSLQAEALYNAMLAAEKWRGEEFLVVRTRCRSVLLNEFGESEWAKRAR
jgi:hypothetical protein